ARIALVAHAVAVGVALLAGIHRADRVEHARAIVARVGYAVAVAVVGGRPAVRRALGRARRLVHRHATRERRIHRRADRGLQLRERHVELALHAHLLARAAYIERVATGRERADGL